MTISMDAPARPWTPARDEITEKLWYNGKSASEIAAVLGGGATRCSVLSRIHRKKFARADKCRVSPRSRESRARKPVVQSEPSAPTTYSKETDPLAESPVTILDLKSCHCRWPIGHPRDPGMLYCGNPKDVTESYCEAHAKRAYPYGKPLLRALSPTRPMLNG